MRKTPASGRGYFYAHFAAALAVPVGLPRTWVRASRPRAATGLAAALATDAERPDYVPVTLDILVLEVIEYPAPPAYQEQ